MICFAVRVRQRRLVDRSWTCLVHACGREVGRHACAASSVATSLTFDCLSSNNESARGSTLFAPTITNLRVPSFACRCHWFCSHDECVERRKLLHRGRCSKSRDRYARTVEQVPPHPRVMAGAPPGPTFAAVLLLLLLLRFVNRCVRVCVCVVGFLTSVCHEVHRGGGCHIVSSHRGSCAGPGRPARR